MLEFLSGAATAPLLLLTQPLSYLKIHYQTTPKDQSFALREFVRKTLGLRYWGLGHWFSGASVLLLGLPLSQGLRFAVYQNLKDYRLSREQTTSQKGDIAGGLGLGWAALFGAVSGLLTALVTCPVEFALIERQLDKTELGSRSYRDSTCNQGRGSLRILIRQISRGQFSPLYQHLQIAAYKQVLGSVCAFTAYEYALRLICRSQNKEKRFASFYDFLLAGSAGGFFYSAAAYPYDMIRVRYQGQICVKYRQGRNYFFRGYWTGLLRGTVSGALSFAFFQTFLLLGQIGRILATA